METAKVWHIIYLFVQKKKKKKEEKVVTHTLGGQRKRESGENFLLHCYNTHRKRVCIIEREKGYYNYNTQPTHTKKEAIMGVEYIGISIHSVVVY